MKRIKTRLLALLLSCCLVTVGTMAPCRQAQAAEIIAGAGIAEILESILLSFGVSIFTSEMISKGTTAEWWQTDGSAALQPYYEDLEAEYERERLKVINGGGNNPEPSPTVTPEVTPGVNPTPDPGTGNQIPTFDELIAPALAGGVISWANGAFEVMGNAISNFWNKFMGRASNVDEELPENIKNVISNSGYSCYMWTLYNAGEANEVSYLYLAGNTSFYHSNRVSLYGHNIQKWQIG